MQQGNIITGQDRQLMKLTAMHHQHLSLGATMADYAGWQRPSSYSSAEEEMMVVRAAAGVCDISPAGKLLLQGQDGGALLRGVLPWVNPLQINKAQIGSFVGSEGKSPSAVVSRLAADEIFISCRPSQATYLAETLATQVKGDANSARCVHMLDMSSAYAAVNVAGRLASDVVSKLTDLDLHPEVLTNLACTQGQVAEIYAVIVRWDQGALPSYDLYFGREYGQYMWEVLLEAGEEYGVVPFGVEAHQRLVTGGPA